MRVAMLLGQAIILAIRPKTLSASLAPTLVGSALAFRISEQFSLAIFLCVLLAIVFLQIATNLINDFIDYEKGTDTADRIGPTRVTQSGLLEKSTVKKLAILALILATIFIWPLIAKGGWPILIIGIISLALTYSYTGGPFPLSYLGLGDFFVFIFFGIVAVVSVFFLQTSQLTFSAFVSGAQVGFLATSLIAINNLRDRKQDLLSNKKTLAVRFGEKFAKIEIVTLIALPFAMQSYWITLSPTAFFLPLLTLPLAIKIVWQIVKTPPGAHYNLLLTLAGLLQLLFGTLFAIGINFH